MIPHPSDGGWLLIDRKAAGQGIAAQAEAVVERLMDRGWRVGWRVDDLLVLMGPRAWRACRLVGPAHLMIGTWRPKGQDTPVALVGRCCGGRALADAMVTRGWGDYVLAWRGEGGALEALRDPSGAVDSLGWTHQGLRVLSDQWPPEADALLPAKAALDWPLLGRMADRPQLATRRCAVAGVWTIPPGGFARITDQAAITPVWRPAESYGGAFDAGEDALVNVVDGVVQALARDHGRVMAELSGGLDSAIVVGSLVEGASVSPRVVNYHGPWPEGDERFYARAAADLHGLTLHEAAKPVRPLRQGQFDRLGLGVRPAFQGLDPFYDADMAGRMRHARAACVTGQGGDAVFFQQPTPWVTCDRVARIGLRGLSPRHLSHVAEWTRRSAWAVAALGLRRTAAEADEADPHPWLTGLERLPPGKRLQIRQLVNAQSYWRDSLRLRAGPVLHPLLTQPVMEHALAIPTDLLTRGEGEVRDRALARRAFAHRLPDRIGQRRNKGDLTRYYGRINRLSLPLLRSLLLEGRLASHGVIDAAGLDAVLTPERLIWDDRHSRATLPAVVECWARCWEVRLRRRGR
ncbi:asparagine synthase-related protein [Brevundimonas diminuta]|uniref:asparagine synthase-related protein n=1 Tax=Brevundimonas diminuta TaxID=293 RepID=UPI003D9A3F06